jgi:cell division protease FtsH
MAGLAAEELVFGVPSTGAEQDLAQATELARDMVGRFGMGARRRRLLAAEGEGFLGDEVSLAQISGQTHHEMELEIDDLLERAEQEASRLLAAHRAVLDALAERLEIEETLEGPDLEAIVALVRPEVSLFGGLVGAAAGDAAQDVEEPA